MSLIETFLFVVAEAALTSRIFAAARPPPLQTAFRSVRLE